MLFSVVYFAPHLDVPILAPKRDEWAAVLTKAKFREFLELTSLPADSTEAANPRDPILFHDDSQEYRAYVTATPEVRRKRLTARDWRRVRRAVVSMFRN